MSSSSSKKHEASPYRLVEACKRSQIATVRATLAAGADPNLAAKNGELPLTTAAAQVQDEVPAIVELLLSHGANVDVRDKDNETPLMIAARWNNCAVIEVLLKHNANVKLTNSSGETALDLAKWMDWEESTKLLSEAREPQKAPGAGGQFSVAAIRTPAKSAEDEDSKENDSGCAGPG